MQIIIQKLRSFIFLLGWYFNGVIILPIFIILGILGGMKFRRLIMPFWCKLGLLWLRISCNIRYEVQGLENLLALHQQPGIVLCKHQSTFDTFFLGMILPPHVFVLKKQLLWIPIFGWVLWLMDAIAIDRAEGGKAFKKMVKDSKQQIAKGISVAIYPEGTRAALGDDSHYKMGGFLLACMLKTHVIPISHNAGQAWSKGQFLKHPGTVSIVIGEPIDASNMKAEALMEKIKPWMEIYANQPLK